MSTSPQSPPAQLARRSCLTLTHAARARPGVSARCLGPLSRLPSLLIRQISGGHRHATHSFLGVAAFGALAWLACHFRHDLVGKIGLGFLVMLIVAGGLEALGVCADLTADLAGSAAACAVVFYGLGLTLVPLVVVAGCATHLAGDALTESGVPLLYPAKARFRWWPRPLAFETGTRPERWIVDPVLLTAIGLLAVWTIAPGAELAVIHGL